MELLSGIESILSPSILVFILIGVTAGLLIGALPGFDVTTGVVLLLPITYVLSAEQGMVFFTSMYGAGVFGGSITAILFGIPGTSESVMTRIEGRHFTRRGEAGHALGIAIVSSAVGGLIATAALVSITPLLSNIALKFGAPEYFALGVLGIVCVSAVTGKDVLKGIGIALIGIFLSTVGADKASSIIRYHYGIDALYSSLQLAPFFIGIFAAAEIFERAAERNLVLVDGLTAKRMPSIRLPPLSEYMRLKWTIIRSSLIGLWVGILPGIGASSAALLSYGAAVRGARDPSGFGEGRAEGIAAPEAANNSAAIAAFIPLLALGIPGSGTTAVLISALMIHNINPGPLLMQQNPGVAYAIFASAGLTIAAVVALALPLAHLFARLVYLPYYMIATAILTVSVAGAISVGGVTQALIMLTFGVFGMLFRRFGYPMAPLVLGFVLGPIIEVYLRRALMISGDEIMPIITRPFTAALLSVAVLLLVWPLLSGMWRRARVGPSA